MTAIVISLVLAALLTYIVVHAVRHDPRPHGYTPPRSHADDYPPHPWYATPDQWQRGTWAA